MNSLVPSSRSLVPRGNQPSRRSDSAPALHSSLSAPIHAATEMSLATPGKLRGEHWDMLGERARRRLLELSGPIIGWFASSDSSNGDDRSRAVVFGSLGLAIAEPRLDADHRPVSLISAYQFDPGSLGHEHVEHRPRTGTSGKPVRLGEPGARAVSPNGLDPATAGLIGNLPRRAQELLQAPFLAGQSIRKCDWYYEGHSHNLSVFMLVLAGAQEVTVAVGTKIVPAGPDDSTAHWSLDCYRVAVRRRIGR